MNLPPIPVEKISPEQRRARIILAITSLVLLSGGLLLYMQPQWVSAMVRDISPGCIFRKYTGIACPGCGGTRAIRAMAEGNWIEALRYNALLPLGALLLLTEYTWLWVMSFSKACALHHKRWYRLCLMVFVWLVPVWFIIRNVINI